jgi:hypothetical protein
MVVTEIPFSQLGSAVLAGQYLGFATAQEFAAPTVRLVTMPTGGELRSISVNEYATSESGEWSVSLPEWERVLRAIRLLEEIGLCTPSVSPGDGIGRSKRFHLFSEERAFVEERYDELKALYGGRYVAVLGRSILDSDPVFSSLAGRVFKRFGYRRVYMPLIGAPKRVYRIPSPRMAK